MKSIIETLKTEDFVALLPPASREIAARRIADIQSPSDLVVEIAAQPGTGLATKGQSLWPRELVEHIMHEIYLVFCTEDPKYSELRNKLKEQKTISATVIVTMLSSAIATTVDAMAAMCVPLVTWVMAAATKTGMHGWCSYYSNQLKPTDSELPPAPGEKPETP